MTLTAEKQLEHIGRTKGCADHDHDLVDELSRRLDFLWRCDQYISNAGNREDITKLWKDIKAQEQENVKTMKQLIAKEISAHCF